MEAVDLDDGKPAAIPEAVLEEGDCYIADSIVGMVVHLEAVQTPDVYLDVVEGIPQGVASPGDPIVLA